MEIIELHFGGDRAGGCDDNDDEDEALFYDQYIEGQQASCGHEDW